VISGRDGKIRRYTANVTVNITFETNGGNPVSTQVVNRGDTATRPDPSRIGYIFVDWYDDEGNEYDFDTPVFENITLYAGWKPITYTVIYDRNADDAEGEDMAPSIHTYDEDGFLTKNEFTRPGYDFAGWARTPDGAVEFDGDEPITVKNLTSTDGDIVTLYARWGTLPYYIEYHANDGSGNIERSTFTLDVEKELRANTFEHTGYNFEGWARWPDGAVEFTDRQKVINLTTAGETVKLYAVWEAITYTVQYNKNATDAIGATMLPSIHTYDNKKSLTTPIGYSRLGHTFDCWKDESSGYTYTDGEEVENLRSEEGAVVTLFAQWKAITYTIVYDKNASDAIGATMLPSIHTYDNKKSLTDNRYIRTGYGFIGWSEEPIYVIGIKLYTDGEEVINLRSEEGAVVILYAQWEEGYTVIFVPNGGTPAPEKQYKKDGEKVDRPVITRGAYNCLWYTDEAFSNEWKFATDTVTGNITLYARWFSTVTFDANDGNGGSVSVEVNAESSIFIGSIFIPNPSEFNFTPPNPDMYFYRWNNKADDTGTPYSPGPPSSIKPTGDITLYAIWRSYSPIPPGTSIIFINVKEQAPSLNESIIISHTNNPYEGTLAGVTIGERYPKEVTITVGNPDEYTSIEWEIHGTSNRVSGPSITLNAANTYYNNIGYHYFTVYGVSKTDGKTYSRTITFIVVE
jgi:uncharacterized repeat protein (TIGR02543 family)